MIDVGWRRIALSIHFETRIQDIKRQLNLHGTWEAVVECNHGLHPKCFWTWSDKLYSWIQEGSTIKLVPTHQSDHGHWSISIDKENRSCPGDGGVALVHLALDKLRGEGVRK
jgi:hypothetical protein